MPHKKEHKSSHKRDSIFYVIWYANVVLSTVFASYAMHLVATGQYTNVIVTSERQCFAVLGVFLMACQALHYLVEPAKVKG
jgi:hypothetical protein